jgi:hypothetical protein
MYANGHKVMLIAVTTITIAVLAWSTPVSASTKWTVTLKTGSSGEAQASFAAPTGVKGTCSRPPRR